MPLLVAEVLRRETYAANNNGRQRLHGKPIGYVGFKNHL